MSKEKIDLTNQTFGRWLVLNEEGRDKGGQVLWRCRCSCPLGTERVVLGSNLRKGISQSCGCLMRELASELGTTHGLYKSNPRLIKSISRHFSDIRNGRSGYRNWTLDPRYPDSAEGAAMFCCDVIMLYPEECARYEGDKTLDLDKDNNSERIFRPECIVFRPVPENRSKRCDNLRLEDSTSLSEFCRQVGIQTCENGKQTKKYQRIRDAFRKGKIHPELLQQLRQDTHDQVRALYEIAMKRQCLQDRVKSLRKVLEALKLREAN